MWPNITRNFLPPESPDIRLFDHTQLPILETYCLRSSQCNSWQPGLVLINNSFRSHCPLSHFPRPNLMFPPSCLEQSWSRFHASLQSSSFSHSVRNFLKAPSYGWDPSPTLLLLLAAAACMLKKKSTTGADWYYLLTAWVTIQASQAVLVCELKHNLPSSRHFTLC